jgi:hypothetical protein
MGPRGVVDVAITPRGHPSVTIRTTTSSDMGATLHNCVNQQQSPIAIWATAVRHQEARRPRTARRRRNSRLARKEPATRDGEPVCVGVWQVPDSGPMPQGDPELAIQDQGSTRSSESQRRRRKGGNHAQPVCRAESGAGRATDDRSARAGLSCAGGWHRPAASPAPVEGAPLGLKTRWLLAADPGRPPPSRHPRRRIAVS